MSRSSPRGELPAVWGWSLDIDERELPEDWEAGLEVTRDAAGKLRRVALRRGDRAATIEIQASAIVFRDVREQRWPSLDDVDANPEIGGPDVALEWIRELLGVAGTQLRCSFCGKSSEEVARLIAGPMSYICDECIELCTEILAET